MSIADHFDRIPDAGLNRSYDTGSARRQFHASLMLVTLIAVVATALGALVRFDTPAHPDASAPPPAFAGQLAR